MKADEAFQEAFYIYRDNPVKLLVASVVYWALQGLSALLFLVPLVALFVVVLVGGVAELVLLDLRIRFFARGTWRGGDLCYRDRPDDPPVAVDELPALGRAVKRPRDPVLRDGWTLLGPCGGGGEKATRGGRDGRNRKAEQGTCRLHV